MRPIGWAAVVLAAAALAGCVTPQPPPRPSLPAPAIAPGPMALSDLPGWSSEDHAAALDAVRQGCGAAREPRLAALCARLERVRIGDARAFLEASFVAEPLAGEGLLTGYFAPEYPARMASDAEFSAPVRARPADLATLADPAGGPTRMVQAGDGRPYPDRAVIEAEPPRSGEVLAWMRPEELFFLQIQGSGGLSFEDGRRLRASFAAHNGRPFVGLAKVMRERGLLADDQTSAAAILAWLAAHRGPEADALMRENPRYVFFKLGPDDRADPAGAAGVPLPAGRAIAIDPTRHVYGQPYWIDADAGALAGAFPTYRRLAVALDTGGAIKGPVRADLYIGRGAAAGTEAGRIRHRLRMWRLVPR